MDTAGLIFHGRHGHSRTAGEHSDNAPVDSSGPNDARNSIGDVDYVTVAGRVHPQQAGVDGHSQSTFTLTKRRLPICSTLPSTSLAVRSSEPFATGSPSSLTPPCWSIRRASELETPNALEISAGRWTSPPEACHSTVGISLGACRWR